MRGCAAENQPILGAVFVENALQVRDRDLLIQAEIQKTQEFMKDMTELFREADTDCSGILTRDEMDMYLQDERVSMYMSTHQLDVSDVALMFKLLDTDLTGEVVMEEFVLGCHRLKGHAKCLDIMRVFECMDHVLAQLASVQAALGIQADTKLPACASIAVEGASAFANAAKSACADADDGQEGTVGCRKDPNAPEQRPALDLPKVF
eukprot:gnl/TRDRNA2_/TRDRNA2_177087_c1_seq3.p1 gnl/TRDRNA2_/TRDRNA2_177087_c1~~gnl/TRDRNA2_/TRDRNA2_177087_c1_seq3.p1  ORF type:complete len:207 (-),score=45.61 gnl/TRDRNA2_/TRDRNA2_177087_c1_seq3:13-633(-)